VISVASGTRLRTGCCVVAVSGTTWRDRYRQALVPAPGLDVPVTVPFLRAVLGAEPPDRELVELIGELSIASKRFATLWAWDKVDWLRCSRRAAAVIPPSSSTATNACNSRNSMIYGSPHLPPRPHFRPTAQFTAGSTPTPTATPNWPSTNPACCSYHKPEIAAVGRELDALLARLIGLLGEDGLGVDGFLNE
jgi:hypothetical protein